MATIQIDQKIELEQVIVEALRFSGGGSRTIREIKESLYNHCHSLDYSKRELHRALENLVHDGFHLDGLFYHLRIKIYPRFLRKPDIEFWLSNIPDAYEDKLRESVSMTESTQEATPKNEITFVSVE